ncbi:MAG: secondary thiamine-phosphate synthase enzyme YjbQ [Phycisphaerae bacterium]
MQIKTSTLEFSTQGHNQVIDLTPEVVRVVKEGPVSHGLVHVFVVGSTAGITTTEFEPGLVSEDLAAGFERIAPEHGRYLHEQTWNDDNGHSHVRASLLGPSLSVPIVDGSLTLGTWQQIVLIDFDTSPRQRKVIVQLFGR